MDTNKKIDDILQQYNKDNPDFYLQAILESDLRVMYGGVQAVLSDEDIQRITDLALNELGFLEYNKRAINYDLLNTKGYMLVARLRKEIKGHKPDEIVGFAMVRGDGESGIAQENNYFYTSDLKEAYIMEIAVSKKVRYNANKDRGSSIRGIGTAMFDCVRQICQVKGCKYITLQSLTTPSTVKFYRDRGMLKSNRQRLHFIKVVSPEAETIARVVYDIVSYMQDNNWNSYKQFVQKYIANHGDDPRALVGKDATDDQLKVIKMLLNTRHNSLEGETIFNVKRALNEMCNQTVGKPDMHEYIEYIYQNTTEPRDILERHKAITNRYMQAFGRKSVIQQMQKNEQQKLMYVLNSACLMQVDKISSMQPPRFGD